MNTKETIEAIADYIEENGLERGQYFGSPENVGDNPPACVLGAWYKVAADGASFNHFETISEWLESRAIHSPGELITLAEIASEGLPVEARGTDELLTHIAGWSDTTSQGLVISGLLARASAMYVA